MGAATSVRNTGLLVLAASLVAAAPASAPVAKPINRAALQRLVSVDPLFLTASNRPAWVNISGGYRIVLPRGERVVGATSPGSLPITLLTNRRRCFLAATNNVDGRHASLTIKDASCPPQPVATAPGQLPGRRFVGEAWGYRAWVDERAGTTLLTKSRGATAQAVATVQMRTVGISALDSPDSPSSNVTLVGSTKGGDLLMLLAIRY